MASITCVALPIVACDFCMVVTATFRLLYVFVLMEHATRESSTANVTAHPTAQWTLQQLREAMPSDHGYRFLIHDRDSIFSQELDQQCAHLGLGSSKPQVRSPQANALCERLIGTLRRECLDFLIPLTEHHVWCLLHEWVTHYNTGRPIWPWAQVFRSHLALTSSTASPPASASGTSAGGGPPILSGLHHEYGLEAKVA